MRKSTLFVSALLTVFLMATMFGVVSAYQQIVKNKDLAATQSAPISQPVQMEFAPAPTEAVVAQPQVVTAEEATTIAIDFLGDSNVYSVEVVDYQGAQTYLVTFSSGDLVYVSSTGVVVANSKIQPVIVAASKPKTGGGGGHPSNDGGNNSSSNNGGGEGEHEGGEHEGGDD